MALIKIYNYLRIKFNRKEFIYIYWDQGFENAPPLVKACLNSWKKNNPDWQTIELNKENIGQYIDLNKLPKNAFDLKNVDLTDHIS